MNERPSPPDELDPPSQDDGSSELLEAAELERAFRAHRPSRDGFRARVDAKITALEEEARRARLRLSEAPEPLRYAAGVLPPGLLPWAAAGIGVGKKLSLKAVPALFSLPAVSLLMVVLTFAGALRGLRKLDEVDPVRDAELDAARRVITEWWARNRRASTGVIMFMALLAVTRHSEALMALLVASLCVAALQLGALVRAGLTDRRSVGTTMGRLLLTIGAGWWYVGHPTMRVFSGSTTPLAPIVLLGAGAFLLLRVHRDRVREFLAHPVRMKYPDPVTTWCLRVLTWGALSFALAFVAVATLASAANFLPYRPSAEHAAAWMATVDDRSPLHERETRLRIERLTGFTPRDAHSIDPSIVDATVDELDLEWPKPSEERALVTMLRMVERSEARGDSGSARDDETAPVEFASREKRDDVREALSAAWRRGEYGGRFLQWIQRSSEPPSFGAHDLDEAAALLMLRYGAPDGIDVEAFRRYLVGDNRFDADGWLGFGTGDAQTEAALLALERIAPTGERTWLDEVLLHRVVLAAAILAAFSIVASVRAPREVGL